MDNSSGHFFARQDAAKPNTLDQAQVSQSTMFAERSLAVIFAPAALESIAVFNPAGQFVDQADVTRTDQRCSVLGSLDVATASGATNAVFDLHPNTVTQPLFLI